MLHFLVTFYSVYEVKCDQKVECGTQKSFIEEFLYSKTRIKVHLPHSLSQAVVCVSTPTRMYPRSSFFLVIEKLRISNNFEYEFGV